MELVAQCFSFGSLTNKPIKSIGFSPGFLLKSSGNIFELSKKFS